MQTTTEQILISQAIFTHLVTHRHSTTKDGGVAPKQQNSEFMQQHEILGPTTGG